MEDEHDGRSFLFPSIKFAFFFCSEETGRRVSFLTSSMSGAFKDRGRKAHKEAFCLELVPLATTVLFAEQSLLSHVTSWELQLKKREALFVSYTEAPFKVVK